MVTRYADIAYVYTHPKTFSSRNPLIFARTNSPVADEVARRFRSRGFAAVDTLVTNDPPSHGHFRKLVERIFTHSIVRELEVGIQQIANELLTSLAKSREVELIENFAQKLPLFFITDQLGVPREDWQKIKQWSDLVIERISPVVPAERELQITDELIDMQQYMWASAQAAARSGSDTLVGRLMRADVDGQRLSPEEYINIATQLFVAGHETTTTLIGHAALLLLDDFPLRERLSSHRSLIAAFIEEALRLHPPVAALRVTTEDTEIGGVPIPRGSMVSLCTLSGNYDPAAFTEPYKVNLDRSNLGQHLSLGRGLHFCIGNLVARAEARIAVDTLLTHFPNICLDVKKDRPAYAALYHVHALEKLHVLL